MLPVKMAVFVLLLAAPAAQQQPEALTMTDVIDLLEARDAMLETVELPFSVDQFLPRETTPTRTWTGTWFRDGFRQAVTWEQNDTQYAKRNDYSSHSTWDGGRCNYIRHSKSTGLRYQSISSMLGDAFRAWLPQYFGLQPAGISWPQALRSGYCAILGTESVSGRTCTKILWDPNRVDRATPLSFPWIILIDLEETLLVWKYTCYVRLEAAEKPTTHDPDAVMRENSLELEGHVFYPDLQHTLESAARVGSLWLPQTGVQRYVGYPSLAINRLKVDASRVVIGRKAAPEVFCPPIKPETLVTDYSRDDVRYIDPDERSVSLLEQNFEATLRKYASASGMTPSKAPDEPQPFYSTTCGHQALYLLLRLHGVPATLEDIKKGVETENASLEGMKKTADSLGVRLVPVLVTDRASALEHLRGPFIAHTTDEKGMDARGHGSSNNHFVVATKSNSGMSVFITPWTISTDSSSDFMKTWTGYALVSVEDRDRVDSVHRSQVVRRFAILLGVGTVAVGAIVLLILLSKRRAASKAMAAASIVLCLGLLGCDQPKGIPESHRSHPNSQAPSSPLKPKGALTIDLGVVEEGAPVSLDIPFENTSSTSLSLRAKGSCGCMNARVVNSPLKPGENGRLTVSITTANRVGKFSEVVDVFDQDTRLLTYWINGSVNPALRLYANPSVIDMGDVPVGHTHLQPVTLELLSHDPGLVEPHFALSSQGTPGLIQATLEVSPNPRKEVDRTRVKTRYTYSGVVNLTTIARGTLSGCYLELACTTSGGGSPISPVILPLQGSVAGFGVTPRRIYLGPLKSGDEIKVPITLIPTRDLNGAPSLSVASDCFRVLRSRWEPLGNTLEVDLKVESRFVERVLRGALEITWGGQPEDETSVSLIGVRAR